MNSNKKKQNFKIVQILLQMPSKTLLYLYLHHQSRPIRRPPLMPCQLGPWHVSDLAACHEAHVMRYCKLQELKVSPTSAAPL